ncbi:3-keto-disaccharide hydrolase [Flavobacterium cellulosilyticum]|uniref:DUF1080 domain-containing protein n=1 Tax=Flavobacterium cellulosilyticum TaxID=2541731 RepID=A0A4R5CKH5_9FLAO|nr:DUF1080 domain-containing protein [Flavobacterium cellulosilyticum]TDD99679.1 DUF1080 domain-containing protein [Flavobacterium cellulosilyticum]
MFKKSIFALSTLFLLNSCAVKQISLTENDWYTFTTKSTDKIAPSKGYEFSNGMVRMYGDVNGYLMTNKSYKNFELSLEFKWNMDENVAKAKGKKNSGVMYNIPVDSPDHIWPKGIQFQIKDDSTGDFIFLDSITAIVNGKFIEGGQSVNSFKFMANENPSGEWNTILIRSFNGKITQYLNGKIVNECTDTSAREGKISLNYEGSPIDFKNIQITNIRKK